MGLQLASHLVGEGGIGVSPIHCYCGLARSAGGVDMVARSDSREFSDRRLLEPAGEGVWKHLGSNRPCTLGLRKG